MVLDSHGLGEGQRIWNSQPSETSHASEWHRRGTWASVETGIVIFYETEF